MNKATLEKLIEDADLVADVGVRLGLIKDPKFLDDLSNARQALATNVLSPNVVADLQKSLNSSINVIAPITLGDIRSGWRPFSVHQESRVGSFIFGSFCLFLLIGTAYLTLLYDRAGLLYATALELQETRGAEQSIRLFGLLKKNEKDLIESVTSGNKDFLYDSFNKSLSDLELINMKYLAYVALAVEILHDLDIGVRVKELIITPVGWLTGKPITNLANPSDVPLISTYLNNYKDPSNDPTNDPKLPGPVPVPDPLTKIETMDLQSILKLHFKNIQDFNTTIRVDFNPLLPNDYSHYIYQLRKSLSLLGSWILPGLYGMLGAVIFHMRRFLEPTLPSPSLFRFVYRIVLGGFAGIILIWFWTSSPQKLSQPAFSTITGFGLAFLVGYSTDIFFQALDRLITYLSQVIGKVGP